jgi:hypothetical protein
MFMKKGDFVHCAIAESAASHWILSYTLVGDVDRRPTKVSLTKLRALSFVVTA